MPDKNQLTIFSKDEMSLLKNTFSNNDTLLYTIRKVFLQFPLTDVEKGLIKTFVTETVYNVLRKRILPVLSPEFPLGQLPSILTTLTQDIRAKDAEMMADQFAAKQLEIDYLEQQFAVLKDLEALQPIKLADMARIDSDTEAVFVNITAYLFLLGYIDPSLLMIKALAAEKEETPEETKERMLKDSSQ